MKSIYKYLSLPLTVAITIAVPHAPAQAENMFDVCSRDIVNSGLSSAQANIACAEALVPRDLSSCIVNLTKQAAVPPNDALQNCFRVRRPVELSRCVIDINNQTIKSKETTNTQSVVLAALEGCTKTVRPPIYAECVTGISRQTPNLATKDALTTCLSAQDYPLQLFPQANQ